MINRWEEQIANGESINMEEAFSPEALKTIQEKLSKARMHKNAMGGHR